MNIALTATQVSRDRWLISYADFMTLLCAFFLTMYAAVLAQPADPVAEPAPAPVVEPVTPAPTAAERAAVEAARRAEALRAEVETALAPELAAGYLQLLDDPRGLVIEVPEAGSFDVGQADLSREAAAMLARVAGVLAPLANAVRVEGHTDDTPIRTSRYQSNWELSTARATRVVAFLISEGGVSPARLSAAGYGEFRPRAANGSPSGRARNRRVDLVLLNEATARAEEPAGVTP
jgi:chemotaxis protein MotB